MQNESVHPYRLSSFSSSAANISHLLKIGRRKEKNPGGLTRAFWVYTLCTKELNQEKLCKAADPTSDISDEETVGKEVK